MPCKINIIEYNPIDDGLLRQADVQKVNESLKAEGQNTIIVTPKTETDYLGGLIQLLLPIILLVAIWMFVMRRMSGGAGGGAGGQIFNIGKSKAKMYEKGKSTNKTFQKIIMSTKPSKNWFVSPK